MPPYGGEGDKQKWVCREIGKKYIDNICPPYGLSAREKIIKYSLSDREKVGGGYGGERRGVGMW